MQKVEYPEAGVVVVGDETFSYAVPPLPENQYGTPAVFKSQILIEQLEALIFTLAPQRIVELGIYRGGSVALIAAIAEPEKFVAIELAKKEPPMLREYRDRVGLGSSVVPYFGVDQASADVAEIVDREFAGELLDFVIDDASHLYEPTRASFEMLFRRLRPGGVYVIEDWAAQHTLLATVIHKIMNRGPGWEEAAENLAKQVEPFDAAKAASVRTDPTPAQLRDAARTAGTATVPNALSRLSLEIVHLAAETPDVVRSIEVTQGWVQVTRGDGDIGGSSWFAEGSLDLFGSLTDLA